MDPFFHTGLSISDSLKTVRKSVLIYETIIELLSFREKIQRIVDAEWNLRYSKKLNRFIKKATLKYPAADLDETIYNPERQLDVHIIEELSKCEWIEQGKNLVITGKT